jgi:hypothetical protein
LGRVTFDVVCPCRGSRTSRVSVGCCHPPVAPICSACLSEFVPDCVAAYLVLPPPPRRLHGHEVFRCPACRDPKVPAPPTGFAASRSRPRGRAPARRPSPPLLGSFRPFNDLDVSGPLDPGLPHPARSVLRVSHPLDGFLPGTPCDPRGAAAVLGVRETESLASRSAVGCVAASDGPFALDGPGAPRPPALRNRRSRAPRPRLRVSVLRQAAPKSPLAGSRTWSLRFPWRSPSQLPGPKSARRPSAASPSPRCLRSALRLAAVRAPAPAIPESVARPRSTSRSSHDPPTPPGASRCGFSTQRRHATQRSESRSGAEAPPHRPGTEVPDRAPHRPGCPSLRFAPSE